MAPRSDGTEHDRRRRGVLFTLSLRTFPSLRFGDHDFGDHDTDLKPSGYLTVAKDQPGPQAPTRVRSTYTWFAAVDVHVPCVAYTLHHSKSESLKTM